MLHPLRICLVLLAALPLSLSAAVAVIEDAGWAPSDPARDGAAEMQVLFELAKLQPKEHPAGLVAIGDRRGQFQEGTQRGLLFAINNGVPVVRLARSGAFLASSESGCFIEGGTLEPAEAARLLEECLNRFGPLPAPHLSHAPTAAERQAIMARLAAYQKVFTNWQASLVASR